MSTVVEKIFSQHLNRPVHAGEMVVVDVDASMMQDINGPAVIENFDSISDHVSSPGRHLAVLDHCSPCPSVNAANTQKKMREFAWQQGMCLADQGEGVCHQVMLESGMVRPGSIAVGTDSHSCMYGALNAFGAAVSAADEAVILACGRAWFRVPETIRVEFTGRPAPGISAMDLALYMAAAVGVSGAQYRCLEFGGEALRFLSVDARATICNIAAETGAKCAIMPYDEILKKWFSEQKRGDTRGVMADADAVYVRTLEIDTSACVPVVAAPSGIDRLVPVGSLEGHPIQEVFIGSCTNGRLEDFEEAGKILRGRQVNAKVRLLLAPASRQIAERMLETGLYASLMKAGALFLVPGCGPCGTVHGGLIGDGEAVFSTGNRNYPGRMGSSQGRIFLGSPRVAACSAIAGYITEGN